ncbi:MAG: hypothetical protein JWQ79_2897 [Mucilaginibacter sp.]|nr:hypothetical protein [Mucilaginibacter sp.]
MQNLINDTHAKRNYDFVDTIRCIAMILIVADHCFYFEPEDFHPKGLAELLYNSTIEFSKLGTVSFFLLSGFLIGEKFTEYTPLQYLKRRFNNTIWPWLVWSLLYIFIYNFHLITDTFVLFKPGTSGAGTIYSLLDFAKITYLYSIYWFIPNFLFCIVLLLVFKKYLYSYVLGAALLCCTLLYSANIYFLWIIPNHTTAIFGFVFFLWLGAQLNKNWGQVNKWLGRTPTPVWCLLAIITFGMSLFEIGLLKSRHSTEPFNTLSLSNVLCSLACFFLLVKMGDFKLIKKLKPRETTYGVYLIHYILVSTLLLDIFWPYHIQLDSLSPLMVLAYQLTRFLIVYGITIGLVMLINKTKFKWVIGR